MTVEQKIRKRIEWLDKSMGLTRPFADARIEELESFLDILKINDLVMVKKEKLRELAELLKNHPKSSVSITNGHKSDLECFVELYEEYVEEIRKKVAELTQPEDTK